MSTQPSENFERPRRPDSPELIVAKALVESEEATSGTMPGLKKAITTGYDTKQMSALEQRVRNREHQFDDICEASKEIFVRKNGMDHYADSIAETGVLGAAVAIHGVNARIKRYVLSSSDAGKSHAEELKDLVKDLHNYANILGMMIMDGNWKPE